MTRLRRKRPSSQAFKFGFVGCNALLERVELRSGRGVDNLLAHSNPFGGRRRIAAARKQRPAEAGRALEVSQLLAGKRTGTATDHSRAVVSRERHSCFASIR